MAYTTDQSRKNVLGLTAYVLDAAREIARLKPCAMRVTVDGTVYEDEYLLGAICNSTSVMGIVKLPEGFEAHIVPRSSTYKKWGVIQANHVGIVDNSYSGPNDWWRMSVIAMRDTRIEKGDKICQFRIVERQPEIVFEEGRMEGEDRGGFGSTGSK
jgi:hypothetical protein